MKLSPAIRVYVDWKRFCGRSFISGEQVLKGLLASLGNVELDEIAKRDVASYVRGNRIRLDTKQRKLDTLALFFRHWLHRGQLRCLPLPRRRAVSRSILLPHVYSRAQIRKLLDTINLNQKSVNCMIDARTFRTFLLFLYGTGAHVGEGLRLKREEVDFDNGLVKVKRVAGACQRTLPLAPYVYKLLREYNTSMPESCRTSGAFFVDKLGQPLKPGTIGRMFQKLRRRAGVCRTDGVSSRPRLHDLRHTFAVHSLTAWLHQGKDLRVMLPALSAYLGQTKLGSSERYLRMMPERFRPQLSALVGFKATRVRRHRAHDFTRASNLKLPFSIWRPDI